MRGVIITLFLIAGCSHKPSEFVKGCVAGSMVTYVSMNLEWQNEYTPGAIKMCEKIESEIK